MTTVRPATAGDVPALAAILAAHDEAVDWPDRPGWPYLEHLLGHARVPVAVVDGTVIGFAGSIEFGEAGTRFLTDLFVDRGRQERGAGGALLEAAMAGATGAMTNSSADPRALALYLRMGMRPWWPLLYVAGDVRRLGDPDLGITWEPATVDAAADRSLTWTGVDRRATYAYYASLPEAFGFVIRLDGAVAAAGWAHRSRAGNARTLSHLVIAPGADPVPAVIGAWHAAAPDGGTVASHVPGPHPAAAVLLDRGIRITDHDQWCASDPDLLDPVRLLPDPSFL